MSCKHCTDSDGKNCYPYYGARPHHHSLIEGRVGVVIDWDEPLPENFQEDPDDPTCGLYTHCPGCGASDQQAKDFIFRAVGRLN